MEWDEIQSEFDRVYGMSCKPSGLQKYKAGHIFDENMSVKWNRDKLEEENKKFEEEVSRLNTAKNKAMLAVHELVYQKIQDDVGQMYAAALIHGYQRRGKNIGTMTHGTFDLNFCPVCGTKLEEE